MLLSERAKAFAIEQFGLVGRTRTNGEPYCYHMHRMSAKLTSLGETDEVLHAAVWLHDVLEDLNVAEAMLRGNFGDEVTEIVKDLTNIVVKGTFAERHFALCQKCLKIVDPRSKLIKLADRHDNLTQAIETWKRWRVERYARATDELLAFLYPTNFSHASTVLTVELNDIVSGILTKRIVT